MPAGHVGYQLHCDDKTSEDTAAAANELANLYQLMMIRAAHDDVISDRLPVGPLDDSENRTAPVQQWKYDRLIPVYSLFTPPAQGPQHLPSTQLDPYRGVAEKKSVRFDFHWQDIYGNRQPERTDDAIEIRYRDPLIGIHQWPSVSETFWFESLKSSTAPQAQRGVLDVVQQRA